MAKKKTTKKAVKKKVKVDTIKMYDSESDLNTYCFPEFGITVQAKDIDEANIKLNKELKKRR